MSPHSLFLILLKLRNILTRLKKTCLRSHRKDNLLSNIIHEYFCWATTRVCLLYTLIQNPCVSEKQPRNTLAIVCLQNVNFLLTSGTSILNVSAESSSTSCNFLNYMSRIVFWAEDPLLNRVDIFVGLLPDFTFLSFRLYTHIFLSLA